jgi:hypothetical protein
MGACGDLYPATISHRGDKTSDATLRGSIRQGAARELIRALTARPLMETVRCYPATQGKNFYDTEALHLWGRPLKKNFSTEEEEEEKIILNRILGHETLP